MSFRIAHLRFPALFGRRRWGARRFTSSSGPSSEPNLFKGPLAWYSRKLETHPLFTKGLTSGLVAGSGDCLSQYIVRKNDTSHRFPWDSTRTARFAFLGCFLVAPVIHVWYNFLMTRIPGVSARAVVQRVAMDQLVFAPLFLPTWLSSLWTLEGKSTGLIQQKLPAQYFEALVANWSLYVPTQIINFRYVPLPYQVLFSNIVGFVWNVVLSFLTHREHSKEE